VVWNDPIFLLFAHLSTITALEALGGLFVFRPAIDWLRLRLTGRSPKSNWRRILVTALVTALLALAYYLWMPGDLDVLTATLSSDGVNPFNDVDGTISRIGLPWFLLFVSSIVILGYLSMVFGFINPILRAVFDALYFPIHWGLTRLLPSEGSVEMKPLSVRVSQAKKFLSGLLVLLLGVFPGLGFLLPVINDAEGFVPQVPRPAQEELELFLGFTKNELIRFSETAVLGFFIFALFVTIAVPFARHVLATVPEPGFNRREIRRVGYWLVTVWIVALAIYGSKLFVLVFPLVAIPVLLWFARPLLEWLRLLISGRERSDLAVRTILFTLCILLLIYGYAALGLNEITAAIGADAGDDVSTSPVLGSVDEFTATI